MPYAIQADLELRYLARDLKLITSEDGAAIDAARCAQALTDAGDEIDGYLGQRYGLPLVLVTPMLTRIACDIAIYRIQTLRPQDDVKDARQRYEDVIKTLKMLGDGSLKLPGATLLDSVQQQVATPSGGGARFAESRNDFSRGTY